MKERTYAQYYAESVQRADRLLQLRDRYSDEATRDALWSGAWQLRRKAQQYLEWARDDAAGPVRIVQSMERAYGCAGGGFWEEVDQLPIALHAPERPTRPRKRAVAASSQAG